MPTRRTFLKTVAVTAGATLAARASGRILGANERINVGVIGVGGRGTHLLRLAVNRAAQTGDIQIVAVCDVYRRRLNQASELAKGCTAYLHHQELLNRKDVDAVIIATPDHWHAPITLAAIESGRDVYCEKPMTHTVEEATKVAHAAAKHNRIVQVGVQATSWAKWHKAKDAIDSGILGQVISCHGTYSRNNPAGDWNWDIAADAGPAATGDGYIDWRQWLGAAPQRPFDADRFFRFRKYWDYSGGIATDLNYHIVAPFHFCVKNEHPLRVVGMGGLWTYKDGREVPDTFMNAADYPGKFEVLVHSSQNNAYGPGTMIRGQQATMILDEDWEGRKANHIRIIPESPFADDFKKKYGKDEVIIEGAGTEEDVRNSDMKHVANFFECVRSRQQPNCHADLGYKTMTHIGLAVRSYREGKMFYFDAERERTLTQPPD